MPLPLQTRLLRVLEEKRSPASAGISLFRWMCGSLSATHCNLEEDMQQGQLRRDLFYRLSILRLCRRYASGWRIFCRWRKAFENVSGGTLCPFSAALRQGLETCQILLLHYDWPGNIRELRNMMERLALF